MQSVVGAVCVRLRGGLSILRFVLGLGVEELRGVELVVDGILW